MIFEKDQNKRKRVRGKLIKKSKKLRLARPLSIIFNFHNIHN